MKVLNKVRVGNVRVVTYDRGHAQLEGTQLLLVTRVDSLLEGVSATKVDLSTLRVQRLTGMILVIPNCSSQSLAFESRLLNEITRKTLLRQDLGRFQGKS